MGDDAGRRGGRVQYEGELAALRHQDRALGRLAAWMVLAGPKNAG